MRLVFAAVLMVALGGCSAAPQPNTAARVQHWIEMLQAPDAMARKEAAFKLGNLGPTDPATVVPALTAALKDPDAAVRCEVILALVKCGPAAKSATSAIARLQQTDPSVRVRDYAAKAAAKLSQGT